MSEAKRFPNFIAGEWVDSDRTFENRNPADTDDLVGVFSKATSADVERAAAAAEAAFPAWAGMQAPARGALLMKVADILEANLDSLGREMTREEGKTLPEAKGETMRSINIFRYFGGEGSRMPGMLVPSERPRVFMFAQRRPLGVVSLINPWNFPQRHPRLEARAGVDRRQHRAAQARHRGAAFELAHRRSLPNRPASPRAW